MKYRTLLLGAGVILLSSLTFAQGIQNLNVSIQGEPKATLKLEKIIQNDPTFQLPKNDTEYHIGIVEPDPSIDYEILNVEIDSDIEYKLSLINPNSANETKPFYGELIDEILRRFKQSRNGNNE